MAMGGLTFVRVETIHPALVHFTVGAVPLLVVAYAVAAVRRSERWTFAGDVALWIATAFTVAAACFGLVSNSLLFWPGGLGWWRAVHLVSGLVVLGLLLALSTVRALRHRQIPDARFAFAVAISAAVIAFTGWVGGEVLVFHAGMAVRGGAMGALSPPVAAPREPSGFVDAMGLLRAELSAVEVEVARQVADHPTVAGFGGAARNADALARLADWLGRHPDALRRARPRKFPRRADEISRVAGHDDSAEGAAAPSLEIENYAVILGDGARELARAARARDLQGLATAAGRLRAGCAGCHESLRWRSPE